MDENANKRTKNDEKDVKIGAAVQTQKMGRPKTVNNKSYPAFRQKRMPPENKSTKKQINDELKRENAELKAKVCD